MINVYPIIIWSSHKQSRICLSIHDTGDNCGGTRKILQVCLQFMVEHFIISSTVNHELNVDPKWLWDTITMLHKSKEYGRLHTVERLKNSFESIKLNIIRRVSGKHNICNVLTERSVQILHQHNEIRKTRCIELLWWNRYIVYKDSWCACYESTIITK